MTPDDLSEARKFIPKPQIGDEGEQLAPDNRALEEALQLGRGLPKRDLKKEAEERDYDRGQRFRDHFERLAIWGMYAVAATILIIGSVWLLHLVIAPTVRWLGKDDLSHLQSIITGSVLAGVIVEHFRKRLT